MTVTIKHDTDDRRELTALMHELETLAKVQMRRNLVSAACFNAMQAEVLAEELRLLDA
jgi:hypothetical protein